MKGHARFTLALALGACRPPAAPTDAGHAPERHLVVAHSNDIHTHVLPEPAPWIEGAPLRGGFVALDAQLDALRRAEGEDAVVYLDAGDLLTGTPLMEFEDHGVMGGAMLDFLDAAGCDAWTLGNHDFDKGYANAAALVAESPMPALSANLRDPADATRPAIPGLRDRVVLDRNGLRIGVFGLTTPELGRLASRETMEHIDVEDVAEVAARQVSALEGQVDLVVALTHIGYEHDRDLAEAVDGIDLIVGGHSHTPLQEPVRVGDTWIVQTGGEGKQLGVVEFDVDEAGRIRNFSGGLVDLDPAALAGPADPAVEALAAKWDRRIQQKFQTVVGRLEGDLVRGDGETPAGRFAADVVRQAGWADIGLYNAGGIRADIPAGEVTLGELYQVFPFGNQVVTFEATGDEIVRLALSTAYATLVGNRGALQWSGATFEWRVRMGVPEIVSVKVGGEPLDLDRTYKVATNSYVAEQWSYNLGFEPRNLEGLGTTVREAAEAVFRAGPVVAPADPRAIRVE